MRNKFLYSILGMILVFGVVLTSTLIYKQKNSQKGKTESGSSLPISYSSDKASKSNPSSVFQSSNKQLSNPDSQVTSAPSNSNVPEYVNSKPADRKIAPEINSAPEINDKVQENNDNKSKNQKVAYLTFDDGPSKLTPKVLDVLKSKNVKATFFVIGKDDSQSNEMLRRMVREGHTVGIHSWTHKYRVIYGSEMGFLNDFNKLRTHIYQVTGVMPSICRFPGGLNNTVCLKYGGHIMPKLYQDVTSMGIKPFDWNVAAHDACKVPPAKKLILQNILSGCNNRKSAVVLLHDTNLTTTTIQALPELIDNLSARGYTFKPLSASSPSVLFSPV